MTSEDGTATRTREISWDDPMLGAEYARRVSGLEYFRAIQEGRVPMPPIMAVLGIELVEVTPGHAVFAVAPQEYHYNTIGTVHGGLACTLLDSTMACAIHVSLPVGTSYTTLELKVNLVRPLTRETGKVFGQGASIHIGRRSATAEGRIVDEAGKLYAHGTTTCMIFREGDTRSDGVKTPV